MAGEYIQANTIEEYWKNLKAFFQTQTPHFEEINQQEYEQIEKSEREDSDNHLNQERLGEDTKVVDVSFYKYLPEEKTAYRTHIVDVNGNQKVFYYIIKSFG